MRLAPPLRLRNDADRSLIAACLAGGDDIVTAWSDLLRYFPAEPAAGQTGYPAHWRDLLPMLAYLQMRHGLTGPEWLLSRLRTAWALEQKRLEAVRNTSAEILAEPFLVTLEPMVLAGLGLGETIYPDPASRHTGILSLLLPNGTKLTPLLERFGQAGYQVTQSGRRARHWPGLPAAEARLRHRSGMSMHLASPPDWGRLTGLDYTALRRRGVRIEAPGLELVTPGLRDALDLIGRGLVAEHSPTTLLPALDAGLIRRAMSGPATRPR